MSPNEEEQKIGGGREQGGELEEEVDDEESEEDGDIDDEEEDDDDDLIIAQAREDDEGEGEEEDEENINSASPSTSSSSEDNTNKQQNPTNSATITAVISSSIPPSATAPNGSADETAPPAAGSSPDHKRQRTSSDVPAITTAAAASEEKKPPALDDSRRLFQRLWTDGDEIGLLQGFLEYTKQRGSHNSSHHHDTAPFYDQIKTQLQLDFNKNQLVEKLRRLKKKYRNVLSRFSSGKEFSFKSPHDQATFEISRKIWSVTGGTVGVGVEEAVLEGEEGNPNPAGINTYCNENFHNNNNSVFDANKSDKKTSRSRKRSRKRAAEDKLPNCHNHPTSSIPNVIEDTVRSCLSPLFKELLSCAISGPSNGGGYGGLALSPLPLNFGGNNSLNFSGGEVVDEKWRKQHILELEVYSKRIELVQDQIKSALEKLKSMSYG
ncbi:probable transcription factor At5g28040 [Macadamia integrifolia]|uniref:probable transcription factor At5g28040 n=1 Tax=Macadamia integrifolia TaxID=60698 RepID=UPI001C530CE3|nr:probable transcription factor At5g28040 [Macadamia integrifolia]